MLSSSSVNFQFGNSIYSTHFVYHLQTATQNKYYSPLQPYAPTGLNRLIRGQSQVSFNLCISNVNSYFKSEIKALKFISRIKSKIQEKEYVCNMSVSTKVISEN